MILICRGKFFQGEMFFLVYCQVLACFFFSCMIFPLGKGEFEMFQEILKMLYSRALLGSRTAKF